MSSNKSKSNQQNSNPLHRKAPGTKVTKKAEIKKSIIDVLDRHFNKYSAIYFGICVVLNFVLALYLFDVKVSTGGDDSEYIVAAKNFIEGKSFPSWHGPFYPIFLGLLMSIAGVKIVLFKVFSLLFIIGHLFFFYYTFRRQLSSTVLIITCLIISINSQILYFASQTYTEALFLFLQSVFVFILLKLYHTDSSRLKDEVKAWYYWLGLGFMLFLMTITRNIGIAAIVAVIIFFIFIKRYWAILFSILSYMIFRLPFDFYKRMVWDLKGAELSGQLNEILLKNPYNSSLGTENLSGMLTRFWDNALIYLSKHFLVILGFKSEVSASNSTFQTILIIALLVMVFILSIRNNKVILFLTIYLGVMIGATFISLQTNWGQMRMIIIYAPILILVAFWGLLQMPYLKKYGLYQLIILLLFGLIFLRVFKDTSEKIQYNQKVLSKNLRGNLYYGFTPDWQNFLRMSEWVGKNLSDSDVVVSRKPSMSFVYSKGKEFFPMYRFPTEDADSLVARLKTRTGTLIAIKQNELYEKNIPFMDQMVTKPSMVAIINQENDIYSLHEINDMSGQRLLPFMNRYHVSSMSADSLLRLMHMNNTSFYGISPDTLLNSLRINNVRYLIAANLRAIPAMKTERIINTVQRYMYIIEMKYPGIFNLVQQIGDNENEPALLYRVNYEMYGLKPGTP
jgi:hypothetical protein